MSVNVETAQGGATYCYDVLDDVDAAMRDSILPEHSYYVLGGIASGALEHDATIIDSASSTVIAAADSSKTLIRENHSQRDIDILVNTILSPEDALRITDNVHSAIDGHLLVSVFGFDQHSTERTSLTDMKKAFLSSRTLDEAGILRYELFPLIQAVQPASYEPWQLELPSKARLQILHPAGHVLAYSMRSVSGIRRKDKEKYEVMRHRIDEQFTGEINDGVFKEWSVFAAGIAQLLRQGHRADVALHPASRKLDMSLFRFKGRALALGERSSTLVNYFQHEDRQEGILKRFIGSK